MQQAKFGGSSMLAIHKKTFRKSNQTNYQKTIASQCIVAFYWMHMQLCCLSRSVLRQVVSATCACIGEMQSRSIRSIWEVTSACTREAASLSALIASDVLIRLHSTRRRLSEFARYCSEMVSLVCGSIGKFALFSKQCVLAFFSRNKITVKNISIYKSYVPRINKR